MAFDGIRSCFIWQVKRMWKAVTSCYVTDCTEPERERERDRWRRAEEERIKCLVGEGVKASPGAPPWLAPLRLTVHKHTGWTNTTTTAMVSINLTSRSESHTVTARTVLQFFQRYWTRPSLWQLLVPIHVVSNSTCVADIPSLSYSFLASTQDTVHLIPKCSSSEERLKRRFDVSVSVHHIWKWREIPTWCNYLLL